MHDTTACGEVADQGSWLISSVRSVGEMTGLKRSSFTREPAPSHGFGERLLRLAFTPGKLSVRSGQLAHGVGVGEDRDRLLQRIKVVH